MTSSELIARAEAMGGLEEETWSLRRRVLEVQREIIGRINHRYALCLTAPLLLLLGATLAMWLRDSLPLTVYIWAFLPSVLDLVLISGGENMIRDGKVLGWVVLWSGNAALLTMLLIVYRKLSKH